MCGGRGLKGESCLLFGEEADIPRHSWFVPVGQGGKGPQVGLAVRVTVGDSGHSSGRLIGRSVGRSVGPFGRLAAGRSGKWPRVTF